ncbi:molybdate ABC transporter substrate-binding protein [Coralloluteibacterium stylophorae]|uniref:Molybdate ABC transporter substrate-binding protein n=1 Tax=Coralloluteibacterium stylophorae TaxID=1776034 RepID=A0A8J7VXR8_9GAMM|nr:molybdate ABC transporter substrate-binding protein [Coralloluteibacterium stylophorae]MBS7458380.1 molybdate ABC transporter substrate-binding protein [Coralloluteibacterium stylophorae]
MRPRSRLRRLLLGSLLALCTVAPAWAQDDAPITAFAAASLRGALDEVAAAWQAQGGAPVRISYAGSSTLARQIEAGAPADVFISADVDWMDRVEAQAGLQPGSRRDLLGNSLVVIAPRGRGTGEVLESAGAMREALGADGRLAMARTASVPAGKYGRQALESLGYWDAIQPRVVEADDVRAALMLVARGEAPLGVVYGSDAAAEPRVRVVATFPDASHAPIVYPAAALQRADAHAQARAFVDWLARPDSLAVFERHGFVARR